MLLYAFTVVVSAFLLFQVEPVIAKIILPWFGGSAAVWTVCLLFFQVVLLLGYAYAHAIVRYLTPRLQTAVHVVLLLASVAVLPIYPSQALKPAGAADPTWGILGVLGLTVGLPYFLLSSTGPLLQAWYTREHKGALPYRLFSLSNAGSMFALLSYPVLFEPRLTTHEQTGTWSIAYVGFVLLCGFMAFRARNFAPLGAMVRDQPVKRPEARQYIMWLLLPFTASLLLLAITNHISQNVAAIPFLWIVPLSLYLLSFILCFEGSGWYRRNPYLQLVAVALGGMSYGITVDTTGNMPIWWMLVLFGLGLFTCCMVCHGELARLKPDPKYLTHFYLTIAAGGALGGIFVGLVAPHIFPSFYELQVGFVLCAVLILFALSLDPETAHWFRGWRTIAPLAGAAATVYMGVYMGQNIRLQAMDSRVLVRNFYGSLRVRDSGDEDALDTVRTLTNGTINHGEEYVNVARRRLPTTYYGPNTGVGIAIREKQKKGAIRIGVVGLGTGTIAAYGRLGDYIRYYEINPLVPPITKGQFYFVPSCPSKLDIAMGDARLSLEREAPENFDVLAVDAFSSDAIPVHLLTKEAMALFFRHLRPDGVLAVHISNRYLDLQPVVEGEAAVLGKLTRTIDSEGEPSVDVFSATWVLVFGTDSGFNPPEFSDSADIKSRLKVRLWTDDYSNLFQILKHQ
ncbi:MAG TPA: fused MFS/spermidine synthase [Bryobacteraceae bacterium]|jgi:peptidoglycan/LPS O-acetylase OafA/YrhL|nr:fused MFS/spermidine synthase [Bryobacteraceae bacterium]